MDNDINDILNNAQAFFGNYKRPKIDQQITIKLSEDLMASLEYEAKANKLNKSEFLRALLEMYLLAKAESTQGV